MKKVFLLLILGFLFTGYFAIARAGTGSPDVTIENDVVYSWQETVVDRNLVPGSQEWQLARARCLRFESDVKTAQALSTEGKYLEAAELHPFSWCKAWYYLNYARSFIGEKNEAGNWEYSPDAMKDEERMRSFSLYLTKAESLMKTAVAKEIVGEGDASPESFEKYVERYRLEFLKQ